jgi:nucleotide-binding universal stress UspA family protein
VFIQFAKNLGAKVTLLYKVPDPIEPIVQTGVYLAGGGWVTLVDYLEKHRDEARHRLAEFSTHGTELGVEVDTVVDDNVGGVEMAIMSFARGNGVDLIGLESHSGPIEAFFIGSVSRKLVRVSEIPIWLYHGVRE